MTKILLFCLSVLSFNSFAVSDCTYENTSAIELSETLTYALEEAGCTETARKNRAKNHLLVFVSHSTFEDGKSEGIQKGTSMMGSANVVNLLNGHLIGKKKMYNMEPKFSWGSREFEINEHNFDFYALKAGLRAQAELANALDASFLLE